MDLLPPFAIGSLVTWSEVIPPAWRWIWTPGPMEVVSQFWSDGAPTQYSLQFGPNGFDLQPGWIVTVEYDPDSTRYYDPPLRILLELGEDNIQKRIHQKWLVPAG